MHVHAQSSDGEAKVWLEPEISLATSHGLAQHDINEIIDLVKAREQEIRDAWREHFGG